MAQLKPIRLSRQQSRAVDRIAIERYGLSGLVLMENAGRGTAELLLHKIEESETAGPIVICCGKGNNAGDGFVIARHLAINGQDVFLLLFSPPGELAGDAAVNFHIVEQMGLPLRVVLTAEDRAFAGERLAAADWIVDALLGTGTSGEVREPSRSAIRAINAAGKRVLAVDLPSGLDCDTGEPLGECVRATVTATFVAAKTGFDAPAAQPFLGTVEVVSIGAPREIAESLAGAPT